MLQVYDMMISCTVSALLDLDLESATQGCIQWELRALYSIESPSLYNPKLNSAFMGFFSIFLLEFFISIFIIYD
jgi:hypothetical protein